MNNIQQVTRFLEEIRYREKLTQKQVADKLGMDSHYLSDLKNGRHGDISDSIVEKFYVLFPYLKDIDTGKPSGRPYYDIDFLGGFDMMVNDQTTTPAYFIDFAPFNKDGIYWCNITGHSMEPKIEHGDIIALKEVHDIRGVEFGEIYAIVTDYDLRTVKIVRRGDDEDHLRLVPINKDFDPIDVEVDTILRIYKVVCNIKKF